MPKLQKTFCRICEAHCGLLIARDNDGRISQIRPDKNHPISQGFVCAKGLRFMQIADHPERLLRPQQRQPDGTLQATSWDAAYAAIGQQLRAIIDQHGVHAVAIYFGTPMIHNTLSILTLYQWVRALGTRNLYSAASQDNANKFMAQKIIHGSEWMMPIMDIEHANFALLLGTNPIVSQGTFVHMPGGTRAYDAFIKRGGQMVVIDPRLSESAKRWGGHIPIKPGTDVFLLLALLNELADLQSDNQAEGLAELVSLAADYPAARAAALTGIPEKKIVELARQLQTAASATILTGVGLNQGPFGTLCVLLTQAIAYLTGNFDRQGGLLFHPWANILQPLVGLKPQNSRIGGYTSQAGGLPCGILGDEILQEGEGQIRALVVVGGNPLTSAPDEAKLRRAFANLELLVCIDLFANETGALADFLLPGTTWLERFDVGAWDAMYETAPLLQTSARMCKPPAETRREARIIAELSIAAGKPVFKSRWLARLWANVDWHRWLPVLLRPLQWLFRRRLQGADGLPWKKAAPGAYAGRRHGRLRFWSDALQGETQRLAEFAESVPADEFILLGRRRRLAQNSWIHNAGREEKEKEASAWLSEADMARLGLENGEQIHIQSQAGQIVLPVLAQPGVPGGTVIVPHGLPRVNINRLISSDRRYIEPVSGMHQMVGHSVHIKKHPP